MQNEKKLWWKVAMHLDEAQIALAQALAIHTDDPSWIFTLQSRLSEGQAILLEIFQSKGLVASTGAPPAHFRMEPVPTPPEAPLDLDTQAADHMLEMIRAAPPPTEEMISAFRAPDDPVQDTLLAVVESADESPPPDVASGAEMPAPAVMLSSEAAPAPVTLHTNGVTVPVELVQEAEAVDPDAHRPRH